MQTIYNRDIDKKKPRYKNADGEELVKNKECATCKNMYTCKGKPRKIERCLNYADRHVESV